MLTVLHTKFFFFGKWNETCRIIPIVMKSETWTWSEHERLKVKKILEYKICRAPTIGLSLPIDRFLHYNWIVTSNISNFIFLKMCNINFVDECNFGLEKFNGSHSISCSERQPRTSQKYFFNKPFSSTTNKENIFKELAVSVQSALTGYNVCIFIGFGKTYTSSIYHLLKQKSWYLEQFNIYIYYLLITM